MAGNLSKQEKSLFVTRALQRRKEGGCVRQGRGGRPRARGPDWPEGGGIQAERRMAGRSWPRVPREERTASVNLRRA